MNKQLTRIISLLLLLVSMPMSAAVSKVLTASFCEPVTYLFGCQTLTTSGTFHDTLTRVMPGDSIVELRLTIGHTDLTPLSATITEGESYLFGCKSLTGLTAAGSPYEYKDTLPNVTGCDSIITLTLTVNAPVPPCAPSATLIAATITEGDDYLFGCRVLTGLTAAGSPYEYKDTLPNYCGEDSIITLTLTVNPAPTPCAPSATPIAATITVGDSYLFGCTVLTPVTVGDTIAYDSLTNICGEDSVIVLTLHVQAAPTPCAPSATPIAATITEGDDYLFGCRVLTGLTAAGSPYEYKDTLPNYCGEDSIVTLTLTVNAAPTPCAPSATPIAATITEGDDYLFGCRVLTGLTAAGSPYEYKDTLPNYCGEDSIITLTLTVNAAPTPCAPSATPIAATITEGDDYLFGCRVLTGLTAAGSPYEYKDTLPNYCGEDSIITLTLTVNAAPTPCAPSATPIAATITEGDDYLFGCRVLTGLTAAGSPYEYKDTLPNYCGEDSIITLTLTVNPATPPCAPSATPIAATITEGDDYLFGCRVLTGLTAAGSPYEYKDTLPNYCGEDSIITLTLTVNAAPTPCAPSATLIAATITEGDDYLFGCRVLTGLTAAGSPYEYKDTLPNYCGEDSIITLTLTVNAAPTPCAPSATPIAATITEGDDYLFGCRVLTGLTAAGSPYEYKDTLPNYCGEDSIITLTLTVNPAPTPCAPSATLIAATITEGDDYLFGCRVLTGLTAAGSPYEYKDTLPNYCGEDSVIVLTLHVQAAPVPCEPDSTDLSASITTTDSYLFGCRILSGLSVGSHIYRDTLTNLCGEDSVIKLTLTVYDAVPCLPSNYSFNDTVAMQTDYLFGCKVYNFPMVCDTILHDTLTNYCGSDSVVTLNLHVFGYVQIPQTDTVCVGSVVKGRTITTDSTFVDTIVAVVPNTPDTIEQWSVYVYDKPVVLTLHVVDSLSALPQVKKGCPIEVDGDALKTFMNAHPATGKTDSVTAIEWYYKESPSAVYDPVDDTYKLSRTIDSIYVRYQLTAQCGTILLSADTVLYLSDYEYRQSADTTQATVCEADLASYSWRGHTYTAAGVYMDTVSKTASPCDYDSIYVLNLTVLTAQDAVAEDSTVCAGDLPILWRGHTLSAEGIYHDTLKYQGSTCDSVRYTLNLTVQTATDATATDSIVCEADMPIMWRGQTISAQGTYYDTIRYATTNCDSIRYTLNLTVQTATDATATDSIVCEADMPILWRGKNITTAGTYYDTIRYAVTNCDSIRYTLNLTVQTATDATAIDSIVCEADMPILWRGQTISAQGTYYDTLYYATGCDSIRYTLNLTVQTATDATANDSIVCEADMPIVWRGQTLITAGTYYDTLYYATGCDSIRYTLNLTVLTATDATATDSTVCEADMPIVWRGKNITAAGTYYDTLQYSGSSCDSIRYTLNLTVQTVTIQSVEKDTICPDGYYVWRGDTLTEEGTYYDTVYYDAAPYCAKEVYELDLTVHKVQKTDSLPAGAEYGMLLLINRVKLREDWNIDLTDDMTDKVLWYQVKGAVDVWDDLTTHHDLYNDPTDQDVYVGSGFYYTDGHNILDGEYYAILDWSLPTDVPCYHVWRTEILTPQTPETAPIRLMPNRVQNGGVMLLTGIDWTAGTTTVKMVTASGQTIRTIELTNEAETELTAEGIPGVYLLRVDNDRQHETLKYIIVK